MVDSADCVYVWFQGKMKSIYENMKNLLDPTPCFDSHICKNGSKVTSVSSYRAFEHTQVNISHTLGVFWWCLHGGREAWLKLVPLSLSFQQYFYEYVCAELAHRPRQVLPYAVISFAVKGKDSALPAASLAPVRFGCSQFYHLRNWF